MPMPSSSASFSSFENTVRTTQIIHIALITGSLTFVVLVTVMTKAFEGGLNWDLSTSALLSLVVGGMTLATSFFVPAQLENASITQLASSLREEGAGKPGSAEWEQRSTAALGHIYQTVGVITAALMEGGALASVAFLFMEPSPINVIVAVAIIGVMVVRLPMREKAQSWLEDKRRALRMGV